MPSARIAELRRVAAKLGFQRQRQTGSHERWVHNDGRATTLPVHEGREIGAPLIFRILRQLGITEQELLKLR